MAEQEFKDGKCAWCEDEGTVYSDNDLCEDCDNDTVHCVICNERQHYQECCRHVFQDTEFEWCGSGVGVGYIPERVKTGFNAMLSAMPLAFAFDLRRSISSGTFHTWLVAPIIGGGGHLTLHGIPWRRGYLWGKKMIELGESEDNESLADGYRWLASLYNDQTPDANQVTVGWITEWVASRFAALKSREASK